MNGPDHGPRPAAPSGGEGAHARRRRFGPEFLPLNISAPFIRRPVATTLLTIAVALAGMVSFGLLPVAPLPEVDFPVVVARARMPGAGPETMAATVATPLERALGRIAGVTEMTSSSSLGSSNVVLQFDLDRDIDGAARDVQAAINAARSTLPTMPSNPSYRKVNPAGAPIMILSITSDVLTRAQLYDAASTVLAQKISQIPGVGEVTVGGGALPAVRVESIPDAVSRLGLSMEDIRRTLAGANAFLPKGMLENDAHSWLVGASDQLRDAADYRPLIVAQREGGAIRLGDVARVEDSSQDVRNMAVANGKPAILLIVFRSPGANIIETVDRVKAMLPQLRAWLPESADLSLRMDRSLTIRASLREVEKSLMLAMGLVVLVTFLFLRNVRATAIPAVAAPVSLIATFGVMYLCGYSLDNLSLMALTVSTGFVVDDAIVVLENIVRRLELGESPLRAALRGAREVGFTVISISLSLVAVFAPIVFMGGVVGRLFREFAVVLTAAVLGAVRAVRALVHAPGALVGRRTRAASGRLCGEPGCDPAPSAPDAPVPVSCHRGQYLALCDHSQGLFPAAGHGRHHGGHPGGPERVVPVHSGQAGKTRRCHPRGPGRGAGFGAYFRRAGGRRRLHRPQAPEGTQGRRRGRHRAPARAPFRRAWPADFPAAGAGHHDGRPQLPLAIPIYAPGGRS